MAPGSFRFDQFALDPHERQLRRDGAPVALNARYLDALALLVREQGRLVSKDRFLQEVWRGVPVTDEALTQCIKTLRSKLGDAAAKPRFIETVPKHGYRFIAPVEWVGGEAQAAAVAAPAPEGAPSRDIGRPFPVGLAGTLGGGLAGAIGGLFYGFVGALGPSQAGGGAVSAVLVMVCVTAALALVGGAGVSFGIAAAGARGAGVLKVVGGAAGGMLVGAVVKLIGLDAFGLLLGQSPGDITGAPEGAVLGAAIGLGAWLSDRGGLAPALRRSVAVSALAGAAAGSVIGLSGGRLMGGSLDLLARGFPSSRLSLDAIGPLFGERGFGPVSQLATGALEGALFAACVVGAMAIARRRLNPSGEAGSLRA